MKLLIENGKCLECNTGGIRYGLGDTNPCADVFRFYRELGGELITIGSDAHTPKTLGIGFEQCREMLKGYGFRYYTVSSTSFRNCAGISINLPSSALLHLLLTVSRLLYLLHNILDTFFHLYHNGVLHRSFLISAACKARQSALPLIHRKHR